MPKVVISDKKGLVQETGTGFTVDNNDDNKPGYITLTSANGTEHFIFVTDPGVLRIHSAKPDGNGSGSAV